MPCSLRLSQISTQGLTLLLSLEPISLHPCLGLLIILSQAFSLAIIQYIPCSLRFSQISTQGLTLLLSLHPISWLPWLGFALILSQALSLATIHTRQSWAQPDIHQGSHISVEPRARPGWDQWGIGNSPEYQHPTSQLSNKKNVVKKINFLS
jgi:hypothetical protein